MLARKNKDKITQIVWPHLSKTHYQMHAHTEPNPDHMLYQCRPWSTSAVGTACSSASYNFCNRQEGKRPSPLTCNWSVIRCALVSLLSKMCETRVLKVGGDPVRGLRKQLSSGLRYIWGICFDLPFGVGDHTIYWCTTDTSTIKARISRKMSGRKNVNTRNEVLIRRGLKA